MKRFLISTVIAVGSVLPAINTAHADNAIREAIRADLADLQGIYTYLHQNPELSFFEEKSSALIAAELRELGFDVTEGIGGYGLAGVLENGPGPVVMVRADMDALPVREQTGVPYASTVMAPGEDGQPVPVMHACGHDVHMTVLIGTARQLVANMDKWSGTLVMIGQPAEERGAGARMMLEEGLFDRVPLPDYNITLHATSQMAAGEVGFVTGWAMANVDSVDITVHGIGGHGSAPHTTKDPIVIAAQIVNDLQTIVSREVAPQSPAVVTVGSFHGGLKHNIISDRVDMQLTVRSYSDDVRNTLLSAIERIAVNAGRVAGLPEDLLPEVRVRDEEFTPSTYNNPELTTFLVDAMRDAGVGTSIYEVPPVMGGEDFSRYGRYGDGIPSTLFWLGSIEPEKAAAAARGELTLPSNHSPFYAPLPEPTILTGVDVMTTSAIALFNGAPEIE